MTYKTRLTFLILLDSIIVSTAIFIAAWVVFPVYTGAQLEVLTISAIALLVFHHLFAFIYKLYNKVWAYASIGELLTIVKAFTFSILGAALVQFLVNDFTIYRRALIVTWMLHIIFIGGSRFMWRIFRDRFIATAGKQKRTLVVGAGSAGAMIVRQLKNDGQQFELQPVAFVDDDMTKQRMQIYDLPVAGTVKHIPKVVERFKIEHIVIAIPSLHNGALEKIITECNKTNVQVQMIPKIEDLMTGKVSVSHLKNVEVEDLLGRDPVKLDINAISEYVKGRTGMVTGAGGSDRKSGGQ